MMILMPMAQHPTTLISRLNKRLYMKAKSIEHAIRWTIQISLQPNQEQGRCTSLIESSMVRLQEYLNASIPHSNYQDMIKKGK